MDTGRKKYIYTMNALLVYETDLEFFELDEITSVNLNYK